jgi:hypothetical protein
MCVLLCILHALEGSYFENHFEIYNFENLHVQKLSAGTWQFVNSSTFLTDGKRLIEGRRYSNAWRVSHRLQSLLTRGFVENQKRTTHPISVTSVTRGQYRLLCLWQLTWGLLSSTAALVVCDCCWHEGQGNYCLMCTVNPAKLIRVWKLHPA